MYRRAHSAIMLLILGVAALQASSALAQDQPNAAGPRDAEAKVAGLLQIIQQEGFDDKKAAAFEELAVYATPEAIPILVPLLADKKLAHYARFALQPIPGGAVDEAFRQALDQLSGGLLIGVINSIGVRKDAQAVEALTKRLSDQDAEVVAAAASALGCIADAPAAAALQAALAQASDTTRDGLARGCLLCAENLAKAGCTEEAVAMYDLVRHAPARQSIRMAGLRGAILARGADGISLLVEQLKGSDPAAANIALRTARELASREVFTALRDSVGACEPPTAAMILLALGELGDRESLPLIAAAAAEGAAPIRVAAVCALAKIGDAAVLPTLWEAAQQPDPPLARAAVQTLTTLPGEKVDDAIVAHLASDNARDRQLAIELIRQRRISAAAPQLFAIAKGADEELRLAAIAGLGEIASLEQIPQLIQWVIAAQSEHEAAVTQAALNAASVRMPDRDACAKLLTSQLPSAPGEKKTVLLEQLGSMGGPVALQCLADSAADASPETQDAATRILGTWIGSDVGPVLLELAKSIDNEKYKIRVLRGYIRIANQFGLPHDEKMDMCQKALTLAQRDEERTEVLEVLRRDPSPIALRLAVTQLGEGGMRDQAAAVAVAIAPRALQDDPPAVAEAMKKVLDSGVGGEIAQQAQAFLDRSRQAP